MPHIRRIYEIRLELFIQYTRIRVFCFNANTKPHITIISQRLESDSKEGSVMEGVGEAIDRREFSINPVA